MLQADPSCPQTTHRITAVASLLLVGITWGKGHGEVAGRFGDEHPDAVQVIFKHWERCDVGTALLALGASHALQPFTCEASAFD